MVRTVVVLLEEVQQLVKVGVAVQLEDALEVLDGDVPLVLKGCGRSSNRLGRDLSY
jgi:hypothetical protein